MRMNTIHGHNVFPHLISAIGLDTSFSKFSSSFLNIHAHYFQLQYSQND